MEHSPADRHDPPAPRLAPATQWLIAAGLVVAVLIAFWLVPRIWNSGAPPPPPPPAADDGSFAATDRQWQTLRFASAQTVALGDTASSEGKIAIDDDMTTQVYSPFTGRISQIMVKAGDPVRTGQPLFVVAANEAVQSDADLATARAQVTQTRLAEARLHDLYDHNGAALKDWQQAQTDLAAARAGLSAAEGRRSVLGGSVAHGLGVVRAPTGGIVTQRLIGPGQFVSSATGGTATQAMTITAFNRVWLIGNLREEDAARARVGQTVEVRPLGSTEVLRATINYVAPMLDPTTRRLTVRAELANPDGHLKPETFATVTVLTGQEHPALVVPEDAVIFESQTARVWVAMPARHRLMLRPITTGRVDNGLVEVTSGLHAGEVVVTAGSLFIDRGAKTD